MNIGVIILARANFGRWPDKVLYKLQGKTILEHVIRKAKTLDVDTVIVSTTDSIEDQVIRNIAWDQGVEISRGEPDNRTDRVCKAIKDYNLDYFVNMSPATPFFDVDYTQILIETLKKHPDCDMYGMTHFSNHYVPYIINSTIPFRNQNDDQEIYIDKTGMNIYYKWGFEEPEVRNRYLYNGNIAYRIQADNHRKICEYLGHFPVNYDEIVKALNGMQDFS